MVNIHMNYPKYNIDITRCDNHIYLGTTFRHNNKVYLISKLRMKKTFLEICD